jgi:hypothetical protein
VQLAFIVALVTKEPGFFIVAVPFKDRHFVDTRYLPPVAWLLLPSNVTVTFLENILF